jgi:hypothetical protein
MAIQQNVKQQNLLTFEAMLARATHFRSRDVAKGVREFFARHGIEIDKSAIVWAQTEDYMLGFEFGLKGFLVTSERRFYRFELELSSSLEKVVTVHEFEDVTAQQNGSEHNRGTGKGEGALAIAVLEAMKVL